MAYVIAVCGAGGKTTLCKELAEKYLHLGYKVCITTSTHMWLENNISDINKISSVESGKIYYFGEVTGEKITKVSAEDYDKICKTFDYVIIEADGSKSMPLKIPRLKFGEKVEWEEGLEPVIPHGVNEIIVVMGLESIGRNIKAVCHRFDTFKEYVGIDDKTIVTPEVIDTIIEKYYINPLKEKFKDVKFTIEKVDFTKKENYKKIKKLALVLCASGFSKRFGSNKLLSDINIKKIYDKKYLNKLKANELLDGSLEDEYTKKLYQLMIEKLILTKNDLLNLFKDGLSYDILNIDVVVVSRYDEILSDKKYIPYVDMIKNNNAELGLSNSIRLAVEKYKNYDGMMFINSDLPLLPVDEISMFLYNSICANTGISSMYVNGIPKNPAYFEKKYFDEILEITGDTGPKALLTKYKKETYKYHILEEYLYDIDTKENLDELS